MKKRLVACLVIVALLCSSLLPAAAAEETDLLVNGGFETGDSTGWNWFNNAVVDSAAPHSGNYCAKVAKNSSYEQVVTVSPDTKYVLTGWAKSEGSSVMTLGVKNYGGQETFSATLSADYQQLAVTFTTGPNAQTATIYGYRQNSGSGAGYFDDVELTAVQDFTPYQPLANAIAPQAIPTYDGTNQPTHP
ncbi:MAG: carbohydrate binding domain-containing protein, partial [Faecalispora jeddahensis]